MGYIADRRQQGQVSVWLTIFLFLAACYLLMTYLPPWYKSLKAKDVVGEAISGTTLNGADEDRIAISIINALQKIGIEVTEADIDIDLDRDDRLIYVSVKWKAIVNYPFSRRTTSIDYLIKVKRKMS